MSEYLDKRCFIQQYMLNNSINIPFDEDHILFTIDEAAWIWEAIDKI